MKLTTEQAAARQPAALAGVVVLSGAPVPGVVITVVAEPGHDKLPH